MDIAGLSIRRPVFISVLVVLLLVLGWMSLKKLPVDLFPNVTFPVVVVNTIYRGAGPVEVETLISKVIEEEVSSIAGVKRISSSSGDGYSSVVVEFSLDTDIQYAEQKIRDRLSMLRNRLPDDAETPIIRRLDPSDQPILIIGIQSPLPAGELYQVVSTQLKPKLEQINQVGAVEIIGGRKRELAVHLDQGKLAATQLSASRVSQALGLSGQNIPIGTVSGEKTDTQFRAVGEFRSLESIGQAVVNFFGNDVPIRVKDLGTVEDGLEDETNRAYVNGRPSLFLRVYRQSGANTIEVVNAVKRQVSVLNASYGDAKGQSIRMQVVRDGSKFIEANVTDVKESILIGIVLTIVVVYLFLGSFRSTIITALALPNSLIGAFLLMGWAGFSINVMSLLALSLSVGLLIDDAIVVRENIFRHLEMGKSGLQAALDGTKEVLLAVIATTCAVIAVFAPIGFLNGVVGQFFKEFGLTICFAMAISLFDAVTVAPMLSAYFASSEHGKSARGWWHVVGAPARWFDRMQGKMERGYVRLLARSLRRPLWVLGGALIVFIMSFVAIKHVPKTFLPAQDAGEFAVSIELPEGTSLDETDRVAHTIDAVIRTHPEVNVSVMTVGDARGKANTATIIINMVPAGQRRVNTSEFKEILRGELKAYAYAKPIVKDVDIVGGGQRPFNVVIKGPDLATITPIAQSVYERMKKSQDVLDPEINYKVGKPEFRVQLNDASMAYLGVSTVAAGGELRQLISGSTPAVFREKGEEYAIRVRLRPEQRQLDRQFSLVNIPNTNGALVKLSSIARPERVLSPAEINRQDRSKSIMISCDVSPKGKGIGGIQSDLERTFETMNLPEGVRYSFIGQAENFKELGQNMGMAALLGILFIYMVLASLYESVVTPFTIMLVLPLAICGAFYALFITGKSLDLFSMIGCIMLLGVATKNSIILVDYTNQLVQKGMDHHTALLQAGQTRLRPILMTTIALIAGILPVAIGLNEASRQRTSMGVAIIGGLVSSTLLTLVVVPAAYSYIERFRVWSLKWAKRRFQVTEVR